MVVCGEALGEGDLERLGRLHVSALPASLVSKLGNRFARDFYRYVASSNEEILCCVRGEDGLVQGASVVSLEPQSLDTRLAKRTTLLLWAMVRVWRLPLRSLLRDWLGGADQPSPQLPSDLPELVHIFAAPDCQGKGVGSRVLDRSEAALKERGVPAYCLKTEDDPGNPALRFYARHGFAERGRFALHGLQFVMLEKRLDGANADG